MANERDLAIRLSVKDAEIVRRALSGLGDDGQRALKRIEEASAPATKGLLAVNDVAANVRGAMEGMTGRLGAAGSALMALGPAGMVAGAAIATVSLGLAKGVADAELADASMRRLESVLTATGHASGLTGDEIAKMGDDIEKATKRTAEEVVDATAQLSTFRSVSGDAFRRATALAVDLSEVLGGDVSSAALRLGRMLDNPKEGLTALSRAGVTFTDAERDLILAMWDAGRAAEAQGLILDKVAGKVGGAAAGADGGLTGATKHLAESWGDLLEEFARTSGVADTVASAMRSITEVLKGVTAAEDVSAKLAEREAALAEYQARLAELEGSGRGWSVAANFARARITEIGREVAALQKLEDTRKSAEAAARQGAETATQERNAETQAARLAALAAERVKGEADAAAKIKTIEEQLAKDVATAQSRSGLSGVSQADVDKEVALLRDVARQKIDAVQKPMLEAQARAAEQTAKILADLQREIGGVADPRTAFIDQRTASLPKTSTDDERQQAAALAGELYDLAEARKADAQAQSERDRAIERGKQFLLQHADAETVYKLQLQEIADLKAKGAVDDQTYALMVEDAEKRKLRAATDSSSGIKRALQDYQKSAQDFASSAEAAVTKSFSSAEDALVQFATTGKITFSNFTNSVIADMVRMTARQAITAPLAGAFLGLFHSGGVVGEAAPMSRAVNPMVFAGAPRFHSGGLLPGEVPIIAQEGERVLTQAQQDNTAATISGLAKMAGQGGGEVRVVSNVYNNASGTQASTQVSRGADGSLQIDTIVETVEGRMATNISKGRGLAGTLEGRYGLSAAAGAARG